MSAPRLAEPVDQRDDARDLTVALEQIAGVLRLHSEQFDEDGRPVCFECWPKVTPTDIGTLYVPWPCPTAKIVLPPAEVREATAGGGG